MGVGRLLFSLFKMPRRASKFRITEELVRVVEPIGQRIVPSTLLGRNFANSLPLGPPIPVSGPTSATRSELQIFPKRIAAACVSGLRPQNVGTRRDASTRSATVCGIPRRIHRALRHRATVPSGRHRCERHGLRLASSPRRRRRSANGWHSVCRQMCGTIAPRDLVAGCPDRHRAVWSRPVGSIVVDDEDLLLDH
jgi:hypothetical protein